MVSAIVSFFDDLKSVPNWIKFIFHFLSAILILWQCDLLSPILLAASLTLILVAFINAYNFMDGINGMNGLYSLAVLIPLWISENVSSLQILETFILLALLVFNYFNSRKVARCFSGDVGSITLAIAIAFLLTERIIITGQFVYVGLLLIYGIDASFTILERLADGENIFKPHRKHLYQLFSNELNKSHLQVSTSYALLQLSLGLCIVFHLINLTGLIAIGALLSISYIYVKHQISRSLNMR